MQIHPALLALWATVTLALILVMIYRATLTQHETDQLFLSDETSSSNTHQENDRIVARVNRIRPIYQGLWGATVVLSLVVAGMYVAQMLPGMKF